MIQDRHETRSAADPAEVHRADEALNRAIERLLADQKARRHQFETMMVAEQSRRRRRRLTLILLGGVALILFAAALWSQSAGSVAATITAVTVGFAAGTVLVSLAAFTHGPSGGSSEATKRLVDLFLTWISFAALAPLLLCVAALVRIEAPGLRAVTRELRVGRYGRLFELRRFRTTNVDVDGTAEETRLGKFLRATGLHDLPMLLNVLDGDMSIVGPYPRRPEDLISGLSPVPAVRPGLVSLASSRGARSIREVEMLDHLYETRWGLTTDFKIVIRGLVAVFRRHD